MLGPPALSDCIHFRIDGDVRLIDLSPNGTKLAVLTTTRLMQVLDVTTGEPIGSVQLDETANETLAFTPDGAEVLAAGSDVIGGHNAGELLVFDMAARHITHRILGPPSPIVNLAYSHTGERLITGCADGTVSVWDPKRWRIIRSFGPPRSDERIKPTILAMSCSPDDSTIAIRDQGSLRLISTTNGKELAARKLDLVSLAFSGAGSNLATSIWYDDTPDDSVAALRFLNTPSLRMITSIRVSSQGGWYLHELTAVPGLPLVAGITDRGFAVWNGTTGKLMSRVETPEIIRSISFSNDGAWFAYVDVNGLVNIIPAQMLLTGRIPS